MKNLKGMNLQLFGWGDVGASSNSQSTTSDLVIIDGKKRVRLLPEVAQGGPKSMWFYTISTPADGYRTWLSPAKNEDFFAENRNVFGVKATHAGLVYDYDEQAIKILEAGNSIWEAIKDLVEAGKDLSGRDIIITKKGTGRSTTYSVVDCDPTPAPAGLDTMDRPDLEARYVPVTKEEVLEDLRVLGFTNPEQIFTKVPIDPKVAMTFPIPFGKHKGVTLQQLISVDVKYMSFLCTKIDRQDVKNYARVVSNALLGTAYEVGGASPSMEQLDFKAPEEGADQTPPPAQEQAPVQEQTQLSINKSSPLTIRMGTPVDVTVTTNATDYNPLFNTYNNISIEKRPNNILRITPLSVGMDSITLTAQKLGALPAYVVLDVNVTN